MWPVISLGLPVWLSLGRRSNTQKFGGKEIKLQQTEQPTATNMTVKRQIFPQLKGFLFSRKYFSSFPQMGHFWRRNGNKAEYIIFHVPGVYNFRRILRVSLFHSGFFFLKKKSFPPLLKHSVISHFGNDWSSAETFMPTCLNIYPVTCPLSTLFFLKCDFYICAEQCKYHSGDACMKQEWPRCTCRQKYTIHIN